MKSIANDEGLVKAYKRRAPQHARGNLNDLQESIRECACQGEERHRCTSRNSEGNEREAPRVTSDGEHDTHSLPHVKVSHLLRLLPIPEVIGCARGIEIGMLVYLDRTTLTLSLSLSASRVHLVSFVYETHGYGS